MAQAQAQAEAQAEGSSSPNQSMLAVNSMSQSEVELAEIKDVRSLWQFWKYGSATSKSVEQLDETFGSRKWLTSKGKVRHLRYREIINAVQLIAANAFEDEHADTIHESAETVTVDQRYIDAAIDELEVSRGSKKLNNL